VTASAIGIERVDLLRLTHFLAIVAAEVVAIDRAKTIIVTAFSAAHFDTSSSPAQVRAFYVCVAGSLTEPHGPWPQRHV
jgi:hypothetical protein